jgi:thiamine monophosphate synthase
MKKTKEFRLFCRVKTVSTTGTKKKGTLVIQYQSVHKKKKKKKQPCVAIATINPEGK